MIFPVFTDPESITGINATYISDTEITLTWDLPEGEYNAFEVIRGAPPVQNYFYPDLLSKQVGIAVTFLACVCDICVSHLCQIIDCLRLYF